MVDSALTPDELIIRGERAKQILEDELVKEALTDIRQTIVENWQKVPLRDTELQTKFHMLYGVVDQFEAKLRQHIESGEVGKYDLKTKRFGVF